MDDKKLSIVVPMYNGSRRIKKCIKSILAQSYPYLELILIDDGSSDGTADVAERILRDAKETGKCDIEVRLLQQENHGVAYTRNYGISLATGAYIAFVDQDDYILPDYCMTYMKAALQGNADMVMGGFVRVTEDGEITRTVALTSHEWSKLVVTAPWAHIYRTEFIKENKIEFLSTGIGEDIYFNLLACAYTNKIILLPDTSYRWVDNPLSVSNSRQNSIHEANNPLVLFEALKNSLPKENKLGRDYEEYFFMRYIVWYFSFTVKGSSKEAVASMYHQLLPWLKEHYPKYHKNPNLKISRPKGDTASIRMGVWLFYKLQRIKLLLPCLKLLAGAKKADR